MPTLTRPLPPMPLSDSQIQAVVHEANYAFTLNQILIQDLDDVHC